MGTRHLTVVVSKGKVKVAQYGQWDGYLSGQGKTISNFIQNKLDLEKFKTKVDNLKWITDLELKKYWQDCGANPNSDMVSMDVSEKFLNKYPHLHRDIGANILELIQEDNYTRVKIIFDKNFKEVYENVKTKVTRVQNGYNFAANSLSCEYAYVLDLDNEVVELYRGFETNPNADFGRFEDLLSKVNKTPTASGRNYYPVSLIDIVPFSEFTENYIKLLESYLEDKEEEEYCSPFSDILEKIK